MRAREDHALFLRPVERADVLVENFRVGATERFDIDYETLSARNARLIYASITGYGRDGPESTRKAYDVFVEASAGLMSFTGDPDGAAQRAGSPILDGISGTFAVLGILGTLYQRASTGTGQCIDISMTDCLVSLIHDKPWDCYAVLGLRLHQGSRIMRFAPFKTYQGADGKVPVGAATDADWGHRWRSWIART